MAVKAQDAVNYKNGQKDNWRRQGWNIMTNLLNKPAKDALVLYLPGTTNLDEEVALRKGFRRENMIAVERDKKVAKFLREEKKVNVIHCDLVDVLFSWPNTAPPVDLIVADLQCGLTKTIEEVLTCYGTVPGLQHSVLFLNAMRGRDKGEALEYSKRYEADHRALGDGYFIEKKYLSPKDDVTKHRGVLIGNRFAVMLFQLGFWAEYQVEDVRKSTLLSFDVANVLAKTGNKRMAEIADRQTDREINKWRAEVLPELIPLPGYRSTPRAPYMDGIVIQTKPWGEWWKTSRDHHIKAEAEGFYKKQEGVKKTRAKIRAALAHRTMRSR